MASPKDTHTDSSLGIGSDLRDSKRAIDKEGKILSCDLSPEKNLSRYLQRTRKFPLLKASEELTFAELWRDGQNPMALEKLVTSHLRLVVKIAMGYRGYGLPIGDLIAEGNIGMMQAVKRFDPDRGFRLATYAMWWIRAAIQEYILHSWSLVKIGTTAAQKKLFFNLRKLKRQLKAIDEGDLPPETVATIADRLNVPEHEVINMNRRLAAPDHSLNAPLRADGENDAEWQDWLEDPTPNQEVEITEADELSHQRRMLESAMSELNERERHIFTQRRLIEEPMTLEELSQIYKISRERVRQIEARAFEKVEHSIEQKNQQTQDQDTK